MHRFRPSSPAPNASSLERNKKIVRRIFSRRASNCAATFAVFLDELSSPPTSPVRTASAAPRRSPPSTRRSTARSRTSATSSRTSRPRATRWRCAGTGPGPHRGPYHPFVTGDAVAATNKSVDNAGIGFFELQGGKVVRAHAPDRPARLLADGSASCRIRRPSSISRQRRRASARGSALPRSTVRPIVRAFSCSSGIVPASARCAITGRWTSPPPWYTVTGETCAGETRSCGGGDAACRAAGRARRLRRDFELFVLPAGRSPHGADHERGGGRRGRHRRARGGAVSGLGPSRGAARFMTGGPSSRWRVAELPADPIARRVGMPENERVDRSGRRDALRPWRMRLSRLEALKPIMTATSTSMVGTLPRGLRLAVGAAGVLVVLRRRARGQPSAVRDEPRPWRAHRSRAPGGRVQRDGDAVHGGAELRAASRRRPGCARRSSSARAEAALASPTLAGAPRIRLDR